MCPAKIQSQNIVKSPYPSFEYPNISMSEYIANGLTKRDPNAIALIDPNSNEKLTFGEVHQKAQEFASGLLQLGITKKDTVLYFADNSQQCVISFFGQVYLGLTGVLLSPACGPFELAHRINDANISVLIVGGNKLGVIEKALKNAQYREAVEKLKTIVVLNTNRLEECFTQNQFLIKKQIYTFDQAISIASGKKLCKIPHFPVDLDQDHYIIAYTSGTTGPPKGGVHSHRTYLAGLINSLPVNDLTGQTFLVWHPLGHVSGSIIVPEALINGMTVVLFDGNELEPMLEAIERFGVNQTFVTPIHATALAQNDYQKRYNLRSLKVIKTGGTKLPAPLMIALRDKYKVSLVDLYGSTECYGQVANRNHEELFDKFEPGNLGNVLPNVEMKIVDLKSGEALSAFEPGEIYFRGAPVFVKYLNNEEATKSTIDEEGWYHTGDVGYYNEKGCLFYTDRLKEIIKYRMWSVIPSEIELFLSGHPAVELVCVIGVKHATDGQLARAYVQFTQENTVTEQELVDYVKENMGTQSQLRGGVRIVSQFPLTGIGKVDRQYFKTLVKDELITEQVK